MLSALKDAHRRRRGLVSALFLTVCSLVPGAYCFGAAGFGVVVAGRGRAVVGADGPDGAGAATPEDAL